MAEYVNLAFIEDSDEPFEIISTVQETKSAECNETTDKEIQDQDCKEVENDLVASLDISETNGQDFSEWKNGRRQVEGVGKWRDGPAPAIFASFLSDDRTEIGSLGNIDKETDDISDSSTAEKALIQYFQEISVNKRAKFDYRFVDNLLRISNVNIVDIHGQTLMHEIAREWDTDIARFLKMKGVDIDKPDNVGRTPLFVAVSSDHIEMVKWLLESGANIHHKCKKKQTVIHYAAFFNAIESLKLIIEYGIHPNLVDCEQQTPLFIAAKKGNSQICNYLLDLEVPAACYTLHGSTPTEQAIMNCSKAIALRCLDQYRIILSNQSSHHYDYLFHFTRLRWRVLSRRKCLPMERKIFPNVLEIIVEKNDLELIMHPVISEFVTAMLKSFGTKYLYTNVIFNVVFTLVWSITISLHKIHEEPHHAKMMSIFVFGTMGCILSLFFLVQISYDSHIATKKEEERRARYIDYIEDKRAQCHPRWTAEQNAYDKEMETVLLNPKSFWNDRWTVVDLFCLLLTFVYVAIETLCLSLGNGNVFCTIRGYYSVCLLIVLWFRLNRSLQILESMGGFIACFRYCLLATFQFAFLYLEFFIPLLCAFWVLFGGPRKENMNGSEYRHLNDMIYQLYLITIVGDYEYDNLRAIHEPEAQFLVGLYILLISIVCFNLYIALLSEAFVRVHSLAISTARINQVGALLSIERIFPRTMKNFEEYLMKNYERKVNDVKLQRRHAVRQECLKDFSSSVKTLNKNIDFESRMLLSTVKEGSNLIEELKKLGETYTGETPSKLLDEIFDQMNEEKSRLFRIQRKTRRGFEATKEQVSSEIPTTFTHVDEEMKTSNC